MSEQLLVAGRWLSLLHPWSELTYTTRRPHGSWEATWTMEPGDRGLQTGQLVEIMDGPEPVWAGTLSEPDINTGTYQAQGSARGAERFLALTAGGNATAFPGSATDQAIVNGLQWAGRDIPAVPTAVTDLANGPLYLSELLDLWTEEQALRWTVAADRILRADTDPTTPVWHLAPGAVRVGPADDDYATTIYGRYAVTGGGFATAIATTTAPWGVAQRAVDLTTYGPMLAARANAMVANILATRGARLSWTDSVEVDASNLTGPGGVPADVLMVEPGQMVRAHLMWDEVIDTPYVDVVIGEVRRVAGSRVAVLSPIGLLPRTLLEVVAR